MPAIRYIIYRRRRGYVWLSSSSVIMPSACRVSTLALLWSALASARSIGYQRNDNSNHNDASVLILGGGVAGVIAARTLYEQGITDFKIIEARDELGGRMKNHIFGAAGRELTVEVNFYIFHAINFSNVERVES